MIRTPAGASPELEFQYRPGAAVSGGGYVWVGAFQGKEARATMVWQWGPMMKSNHPLIRVMSYLMSAGVEHAGHRNKTFYWPLPSEANRRHAVRIDLAKAVDAATKPGTFRALGVDRILIGIGAWCAPAPGSKSEAWFDDVNLGFAGGSLTIDGKPFDAARNGRNLVILP